MHVGGVHADRRLISLDVLHSPRSFEADYSCVLTLRECLLFVACPAPSASLLLELPLFFDVQALLEFMCRLGHRMLQVLLGRLRGIAAN